MYSPDLSPYTYFPNHRGSRILNVGWLDHQHEYPRGTVPKEIIDLVFQLCTEEKVHQMRGFHRCQLCSKTEAYPTRVVRGQREALLGSAEIHVPGPDGTIYAAPDMIYHYIVDHGYLPPPTFLDALLCCRAGARPRNLARIGQFLGAMREKFLTWFSAVFCKK